jgi:hypothetical protein
MPTPDMPTTTEELLAEMLEHMRRMDRRDRLRTMGGTFKGILSLIPMVLFLWSAWYFYAHGEELMQKFTEQATNQAMKASEAQSQKAMDQLKEMMGR